MSSTGKILTSVYRSILLVLLLWLVYQFYFKPDQLGESTRSENVPEMQQTTVSIISESSEIEPPADVEPLLKNGRVYQWLGDMG